MSRDSAAWPRDHADAARRVLPHLPPGSRARLVPIGEGDDSLAFRQGARVVRVAKHAASADRLAREACVLAGIADALPLAVPRPAFVRADATCAFAVHAHLPGTALTSARWERLPAAARERTAAQLAGFVAALHALPTDTGARCGVPTLDLATRSAALRPALARLPSVDARIVARLDDSLAGWETSPAPRRPALLHADLDPGHVLHDARSARLTGVIDFGDLAIGDPARDLVYVHDDFGPAMLELVLDAYPLEPAATLRPRVLAWYVVEALDWTVERAAAGAADDVAHGIEEALHALDDGA